MNSIPGFKIILVLLAIIMTGCATVRPVIHEGERRNYYSRYVSDTFDSIQQLAIYEKSMTFELIALSKRTFDIRANLLYYYGQYEITDSNDIIFYIFARDPRFLRLLQSSEQQQSGKNGPVTQKYHILTFNKKMIRLQSELSRPLFHLYFGPIEDGKPPTIFTEV